jgi:membrane protease YdiL (CAAX protease family)
LLSTPTQGPYLVRLELFASGLLLGLAGTWSALRGLDLMDAMQPSLGATTIGAACGLALAVTLPLITASWASRVLVLRGLRRAWDWLESGLGPSLGVREILVLACCSAISEEIFFRGVLQREVGIVAASAVFGLLHPLGIAYVLWPRRWVGARRFRRDRQPRGAGGARRVQPRRAPYLRRCSSRPKTAS